MRTKVYNLGFEKETNQAVFVENVSNYSFKYYYLNSKEFMDNVYSIYHKDNKTSLIDLIDYFCKNFMGYSNPISKCPTSMKKFVIRRNIIIPVEYYIVFDKDFNVIHFPACENHTFFNSIFD